MPLPKRLEGRIRTCRDHGLWDVECDGPPVRHIVGLLDDEGRTYSNPARVVAHDGTEWRAEYVGELGGWRVWAISREMQPLDARGLKDAGEHIKRMADSGAVAGETLQALREWYKEQGAT